MFVTRKYFVFKMKELWDVVRGILDREKERAAVDRHDRVVRFAELYNKLDYINNRLDNLEEKVVTGKR